jgi:hypothetical protein
LFHALWLFGATGCDTEPLDLPTEEALAEVDEDAQTPLFQLLYDAPTLPVSRLTQQRVRLLLWLRHMELSAEQLELLTDLRRTVVQRRESLAKAERDIAARWEPLENQVYQGLWAHLSDGGALDDPALSEHAQRLQELRSDGARERELLSLRLQGIQAIFEAERPFLQTLSPRQESLLPDALFLLRSRLDPVGNPEDFRALVGSIYDPGDFAVLSRGTAEQAGKPLDIGALWTDEGELTGEVLHAARRELLVYLALLEPGIDEALQTALKLARGTPAQEPQTEPSPSEP